MVERESTLAAWFRRLAWVLRRQELLCIASQEMRTLLMNSED